MLKDERGALCGSFLPLGCASPSCGAPGGQRGFTIMELMVAVTVSVVLIAVAVPAFSALAARNDLTVATNSLRGALLAARQAAVTQGRPVGLCAGSPTAGCTGNWRDGRWMVFRDADHGGDLDAGETVIRSGGVPGGARVDGNGPLDAALVYVPMGHAEWPGGGFGAGRLRICVPHDLAFNARELVISASGRVRLVSRDFGGSCPAL
ncbi:MULTISPECIES: GspH/FimT family pseudopilin [unclassified Guyparkeria]|uniref:GspH/FimT family pseudopilin n=1 Tax=unclassified Guyparkeria TaxID=2626246 RepID=UPI0007337CC1|nr:MULTISPECIES: GspH/FimT family pseudopilin [unclassified Guyparkeria]KTG16805.1 hypothetical protein AUR63_01700 [Guyparkeria sp. XI15]OAE85839.1 hypothetical protein AWR35_01700 [Guyparkeria sp. WRN-7]